MVVLIRKSNYSRRFMIGEDGVSSAIRMFSYLTRSNLVVTGIQDSVFKDVDSSKAREKEIFPRKVHC